MTEPTKTRENLCTMITYDRKERKVQSFDLLTPEEEVNRKRKASAKRRKELAKPALTNPVSVGSLDDFEELKIERAGTESPTKLKKKPRIMLARIDTSIRPQIMMQAKDDDTSSLLVVANHSPTSA